LIITCLGNQLVIKLAGLDLTGPTIERIDNTSSYCPASALAYNTRLPNLA